MVYGENVDLENIAPMLLNMKYVELRRFAH